MFRLLKFFGHISRYLVFNSRFFSIGTPLVGLLKHYNNILYDFSHRSLHRMGAHMITDTAQEHQVEKIIMHESYNSPLGLAHDIALLKLTTAVTMGNAVGTVCLPDINHPLLSGKQCYITGWGTLTSGGSQPDQLMEASVPIVSQASCSNAYPGQIHDSMICAGLDAGGVDACQGDSGGPMVCEFNGKWYLEGATSWGYGCAVAGKYGVYAKVRYLKTWVENKMSSE